MQRGWKLDAALAAKHPLRQELVTRDRQNSPDEQRAYRKFMDNLAHEAELRRSIGSHPVEGNPLAMWRPEYLTSNPKGSTNGQEDVGRSGSIGAPVTQRSGADYPSEMPSALQCDVAQDRGQGEQAQVPHNPPRRGPKPKQIKGLSPEDSDSKLREVRGLVRAGWSERQVASKYDTGRSTARRWMQWSVERFP